MATRCGQFLFQLGASISRGGLPRQLDHKPQPVLAIPQLCIRGQPIPVQMRVGQWQPCQRLCDPRVQIVRVQRLHQQFHRIQSDRTAQVGKARIAQTAQHRLEEAGVVGARLVFRERERRGRNLEDFHRF